MTDRFPQRIVCLSAETVDVIYRLGEERRIAGISGYTVTPPRARREKPKVSAFATADIPKILALEPDLVLAFSDLQAEIARDLAKAGVEVHLFNQRDVAGILRMIVTLGALVGVSARAEALAREPRGGARRARAAAELLPRRPRVYFEEWDAPMIAGIGWVSEARRDRRRHRLLRGPRPAPGRERARHRRSGRSPRRAPDIVIGSWCGKRFRAEQVARRPGWSAMPAVAQGRLHEIKSALILQPGPTALTEGLARLRDIIAAWALPESTVGCGRTRRAG